MWPILADPGTVTMRGCGVAPATASGCVEHEAILVADNRSAGRRARSCATQLWPLRFRHQKGTKALQQCFLSRLAQKPRAEAPLFPQKCLKKPVQAKFLHGDRTSDSGFQRPQLARCVGACQPFTQALPLARCGRRLASEWPRNILCGRLNEHPCRHRPRVASFARVRPPQAFPVKSDAAATGCWLACRLPRALPARNLFIPIADDYFCLLVCLAVSSSSYVPLPSCRG